MKRRNKKRHILVYPEDIPKYFKQLEYIEALVLTLYYYWGLEWDEIYQEFLGAEHEMRGHGVYKTFISAKKNLRELIKAEDKTLNG